MKDKLMKEYIEILKELINQCEKDLHINFNLEYNEIIDILRKKYGVV